MKAEEVANVLAEFNTWRRGLPPYEWNEDPSKQKELQYSAKEIGVAIDEAVDMLRQAADMMKREMKYEYMCLGRVFQTLNGARIYAIANKFQELRPIIVRREVGAWEEVKDV